MPSVPECDSRKEAPFSEAQKYPGSDEARKVVDDSHKRCADGPSDHDGWYPDGRADLLQNEIRRYLREDVLRG